jgi:hypothetical protein
MSVVIKFIIVAHEWFVPLSCYRINTYAEGYMKTRGAEKRELQHELEIKQHIANLYRPRTRQADADARRSTKRKSKTADVAHNKRARVDDNKEARLKIKMEVQAYSDKKLADVSKYVGDNLLVLMFFLIYRRQSALQEKEEEGARSPPDSLTRYRRRKLCIEYVVFFIFFVCVVLITMLMFRYINRNGIEAWCWCGNHSGVIHINAAEARLRRLREVADDEN